MMPMASAAGAPCECDKCGHPADSEYLFFDAESRHTLMSVVLCCGVSFFANRDACGPRSTALV